MNVNSHIIPTQDSIPFYDNRGVVDYNPITYKFNRLGYWNNTALITTETFPRDELIVSGKRILIPKLFEQGIVDITLR